MMLHVICGYPSNSDGTYTNWKRSDYDASKLVKAVKGKPFKGYATIKQGDREYRFENDAAGRETARGIAARAMAGKIHQHLGLQEAAIVPVPASDHIEFGAAFTGSILAEAMQAFYAQYRASPVVTFDQVMEKASQGGSRDPAVLLPHLRLNCPIPPLPIVLLDDVTSTHGHLKAVARKLRAEGREVAGAVCVAQTVWERPEQIFGIPPKELYIDSWPGDHPGLFD